MPIEQATLPIQITTPLGADKLRVERLHGDEHVSDLFSFELDLVSDDPELDFDAILGQGVSFTVSPFDTVSRTFHGLCTRFVLVGNDGGAVQYRAVVRPWLWMLSLGSETRIFQNMSTTDIVAQVFDELGFTDYRIATTGTYTPREYCTQFRETHLQFVSRLLEEEGIFYYFEHADDAHTLVIADDASAYGDVGSAEYFGMRARGYAVIADAVTECALEREVTTGKYGLNDYHFETPATDLFAIAEGTASTLQRVDWPGGFTTKDAGEARAKIRLDSVEIQGKRVTGQSTRPLFTAGSKFTLANHPREDMNVAWALLSVSHRADQNAYENNFVAVPGDKTYRPALVTPRPQMPGPQTAVVVGLSGEEIYTDKYGRVKIQFHWDRVGVDDENSSCFVRVAQSWVGKAWGAVFTPRIGQEVVVTFLDGDPDRPLVTGGVYNATNLPPYTLPDDKTKSSIKTRSTKAGTAGNEIRFEDLKDSEELYIHAQKDMKVEVENDRTTDVKHDETVTVKNKRAVTISEGDESLTVSKGKREVTVTEGEEIHTVGGKRTVKVTGDELHTSEAKFTHNVTGDYKLVISGKLEIEVTGEVSIKAGGDLKLKSDANVKSEAGSAWEAKSGTELKAEAGTALTNKAGTALTNEAGTNLKNKAGANLDNEAGAMMNNKASASQTVDGGGMLTLKGGMVKIN